jgi:hypothetical protein
MAEDARIVADLAGERIRSGDVTEGYGGDIRSIVFEFEGRSVELSSWSPGGEDAIEVFEFRPDATTEQGGEQSGS